MPVAGQRTVVRLDLYCRTTT